MENDRRRTDTRARIRAAALELFTSQGYGATSLGQVAEQLGITRPAVYHHFRSKEDLLTDSYEGLHRELDTLASADRHVALERLDELLAGEHGPLLVCASVNEHALRGLPQAADLARDLDRLATTIATDDSVTGRMRGRLALAAVTMAHARASELGGDPDERRAAARQVVGDLLGKDTTRDEDESRRS